MHAYVPKRRARGEGLFVMARFIRNTIAAVLLLCGSLWLGERLAYALLVWRLT